MPHDGYVHMMQHIWADAPLLRPHLAVCGSALASPAPGGESFSRRPRWPGCPPGYAALQHPACPARPSPAHLPAVAGNPDQTECYRGGGTNYLHWCWWFLMTSNRSLGKYKETSGREVMATEISWKLSHGRKQQRDTRSARWSEKETEGQKGRKGYYHWGLKRQGSSWWVWCFLMSTTSAWGCTASHEHHLIREES